MPLPHDEAGAGRTVILLHARPTDRRMWREHLPLLAAAGYRAIALDLLGYGEAVLPEGHAAPPADGRPDQGRRVEVDRRAAGAHRTGPLSAGMMGA